MPTVNEKIFNAQVKHSVYLERYKANVLQKILKILNDADEDLTDQLAARLVRIDARGFDLGPETTKRLTAILAEIEEKRNEVYAVLDGDLTAELIDFSKYEADFQIKSAKEAGVEASFIKPSNVQLRAVVLAQPFQGALLKEWTKGLAQNDVKRIKQAVKLGIVEGQTIEQIVRRVRGTKAARYQDGILEISRREAAGVVRTSVAHVQNRAAAATFNANADIVDKLKYSAVLDSKTTVLCASRDGNVYDLGKEPPLPAHFNCRSVYVPYFGPPDEDAKRASIYGQVPKSMTYEQFLKQQSIEFQEDVLGVERARLFREGKVTLDKFVDNSGKTYTLKQLKKRERLK